jgi:aspartate/tyrosine/aromatic aminotransferase
MEKRSACPSSPAAITHGIATVLADMWANPGDVIILPEMMWGNYNMIFHGAQRGARIRHYPLCSMRIAEASTWPPSNPTVRQGGR